MDLDELRRKRKEDQRRRRRERLAQINLSAPTTDPLPASTNTAAAETRGKQNEGKASEIKSQWQNSSSGRVRESSRARQMPATNVKKSSEAPSSSWFDSLEPPKREKALATAKTNSGNNPLSLSDQSTSGAGVYMPNGRKDILDKELTSPASSITFSQEPKKSHVDGTPQKLSSALPKIKHTPDQDLMEILEKPTPPSARRDLSPLFFETESTKKKKQSTNDDDFDFPLADPPESASLNLELELDLQHNNSKARGAAKKLPPKRARRMSSSSDSSDDSFDLVKLAKQKEEKDNSQRQTSQTKQAGDTQNGDRMLTLESSRPSNDRPGPSSPNGGLDSSPQHVDRKDDSQSSFSRKPRNPLTLMKEAEAATERPSVAENRIKFAGGGLDERMWADPADGSEDEELNSRKNKPKKKRQTVDRRESSERDFRVNGEGTVALPTVDFEKYMGQTDAEVDNELKPDFPNPSYGTSDLAPLKLSAPKEEGNGEEDVLEVEVPASIARYLIGYQKQGVKFCFEALMKKGGCILGDDMGLGKTVQTIALLSAMLVKTGTGKDLRTIRDRLDDFTALKRQRREALERALQSGEVPSELEKDSVSTVKSHQFAPILICAPSSVVTNWITDFSTWGHFAVYEFCKDNDYSIEPVLAGLAEVLLISHSQLASDNHFKTLNKVPWKLCVIDEFHIFKGVKSRWAKNTRKLRGIHGTRILGLTGTVMQNNHDELWNLVDLAVKGFLGDWDFFRNTFSNPIKYGQAKDATDSQIQLGYEKSEELTEKLHEIYLRREKEEVLKDELPRKDERIVFCEPSAMQKAVYRHILTEADAQLVKNAQQPCDCGINAEHEHNLGRLKTSEEKLEYYRKHKGDILKKGQHCYNIPKLSRMSSVVNPRAVLWRQQHPDDETCMNCPFCMIFPMLNILHKVSTHVGLIQPVRAPDHFPPGTKERSEAETYLERAKIFIPEDQRSSLPGGSLVRNNDIMNDHFALSGKMKVLEKLLRRIEIEGGRVLIFSAFTSTLDFIQSFIQSAGYTFLRMDGTTPQKKRKEIADEFKAKNDIFVFLLSTKAMGLGLNLTAASWVILFDVEWNPSYDAQAQDRSYRLGQLKDVKVFRLVCRGTIEELKYLRQVYKIQLKSETIVDDQREASRRIFRGVDKDKSRRGELFGVLNLLRFNDGPFMNYGRELPEAKSFGSEIFDMASFERTANSADSSKVESQDLQDLIDMGLISHYDATMIDSKREGSNAEANSVNLGALDTNGEVPDTSTLTAHADLATDDLEGIPDVEPAAASSNNRVSLTNRRSNPEETNNDSQPSEKEAAKRSKKREKDGKRNLTAFSKYDLALPSGFNKKKKKKRRLEDA